MKRKDSSIKRLGSHGKKSFLFVLAIFSRTYIPIVFLGVLCRLFFKIDSVFFCYAGNKHYSNSYCYPSTRDLFIWFPNIIGIFKQGHTWGIVFASPVTEEEFQNQQNLPKLEKLIQRLDLNAKIIGAAHINYAGVLPSFLEREKITHHAQDFLKIADVVTLSIENTISEEFDEAPNLIIIGGNGHVGRKVQRNLRERNLDYHVVDIAGKGLQGIPKKLQGQPTLILDVSRKGVIEKYLSQIWSNTVILNETFPEPSSRVINILTERNIKLRHISGVKGKMIPPLPGGYKAAIPCCAIHSDEKLEPVVIELNHVS